jgi:hypothetical protein
MDIQHQVFLTSALDRYQWSASHPYLTYMKRILGIHLVKGWVEWNEEKYLAPAQAQSLH